MASTLTTVLPELLEHARQDVENIFFNPDDALTPLMASMDSKSENDGAGTGYKVRFMYSKGSSVSADFAAAQAISAGATGGHAALGNAWVIQAKNIEATAEWTRDTLKAGEGNPDDTFDIMATEMDAKIAKIRQRIAICGWESGYGRVATMSAVGNPTITIPSHCANRLEVGDFLVASSSATGALRNSGTAVDIIGIGDDVSGTTTITMSADISAGPHSWGATDTIFQKGDHVDSTITCPVGMAGWVPTTAPSGAFFGVTRTGIPQLCGTRRSYSGKDHSTALILAAGVQMKNGIKSSEAYLSAEDFGVLTCDKESVKTVAINLGKYQIGFDAFPLLTPNGVVKVLPDIYMEQGTFWMGPFSNKKFAPFLIHNDNLVNVDDTDGNTIRAKYNSTNLEMRLFFRGGIGMVFPGAFHCGTGLASS